MSAKIKLTIPKTGELRADLRAMAQLFRNMTGVNEAMSNAVIHGTEFHGERIIGVSEHIRLASTTRHTTARRLGARITGYLEAAADQVLPNFDNRQAGFIISNNSAIFSRAFGAVRVRVQDNQWLCIPADRRTYGRSPMNFDLKRDFTFVVFRKNELAAFLWRPESHRRLRTRGINNGHDGNTNRTRNRHVDLSKRTPRSTRTARHTQRASSSAEHKLDVAFWCKKEVTLPQDRGLLPSNEDILTLMEAGLNLELERRFAVYGGKQNH